MFAKDGMALIIATFLAFLISLVMWYYLPHPLSLLFSILLGILSIFNLFFFRDPQREVPRNPFAVISPADGKVLQIVQEKEEQFFHGTVQRVSIFLSVFNVHVNRAPVGGTVNFFSYRTGRFLAAYRESASAENEQTVIGIVDTYGHKIMFKQIAGLIARRIVCHLREGSQCRAGERMGLIRYGSRVDVFLPYEARLQIKKGQRVRGGETVLATFPDEGQHADSQQKIVEAPRPQLSS